MADVHLHRCVTTKLQRCLSRIPTWRSTHSRINHMDPTTNGSVDKDNKRQTASGQPKSIHHRWLIGPFVSLPISQLFYPRLTIDVGLQSTVVCTSRLRERGRDRERVYPCDSFNSERGRDNRTTGTCRKEKNSSQRAGFAWKQSDK